MTIQNTMNILYNHGNLFRNPILIVFFFFYCFLLRYILLSNERHLNQISTLLHRPLFLFSKSAYTERSYVTCIPAVTYYWRNRLDHFSLQDQEKSQYLKLFLFWICQLLSAPIRKYCRAGIAAWTSEMDFRLIVAELKHNTLLGCYGEASLTVKGRSQH